MATLDDAAVLALGLPDVEEGVRHGGRTWHVGGKVFAWERPFSKADLRRFGDETPPEGEILGVLVADLHEKAAVLAEGRRGFFTIPHFDNYPALLIQLRVVGKRDLRTALTDGYRSVAG